MVGNVQFDPKIEDTITAVENACVESALRMGKDVIVDATHLKSAYRKRWFDLAERTGDVTVIVKVFNVDLQTCIERNKGRLGEVPENVITGMHRRFVKGGKPIKDERRYFPPLEQAPACQDEDLPRAVVCDLDGTLAEISHRNPYDAQKCEDDGLNEHVAELIKAMYARGYKILFVSGREDLYRPETERWLKRHMKVSEFRTPQNEQPFIVDMPYKLFMRSTGDRRKDTVIKRGIYDREIKKNYFVQFVIDDRPCVVRMWRYDLGIPVMQVNDREF
jgi:hypothetical protein